MTTHFGLRNKPIQYAEAKMKELSHHSNRTTPPSIELVDDAALLLDGSTLLENEWRIWD